MNPLHKIQAHPPQRAFVWATSGLALCLWLTNIALGADPSTVAKELVVGGEVQHELRLKPDDVRQIAKRRGVVEQGGYTGIRLVDLLAEAQIKEGARLALRRTYIVALATDNYPAVFSWGELYNTAAGAAIIVATDRDGVPLREGEGQFALVALGDTRPGPRHVKWLTRIDVRRVAEEPR